MAPLEFGRSASRSKNLPRSIVPLRTISRRSRRCWARSWSTTRRFYRVSDFLDPEHFFEPIHQKIYQLARDLIRAGKIATPVTLKTFLDADVDIGGMTVEPVPRAARRRSDHHHQCRGLRPHHLRPVDPPRADPGRRGHGQCRLRRAGRFLAAQPDRGRRAQALRTGRDRPLRRRLPALRAGAHHRGRHGGARLPARRQAVRPRHRPRRSRPHDGRPAAVRLDHPRRPSRHGQNRARHQYRLQRRPRLARRGAARRPYRHRQWRHRRLLLAGNVGRAARHPYHRRADRHSVEPDPARRHQRGRLRDASRITRSNCRTCRSTSTRPAACRWRSSPPARAGSSASAASIC